VPVSFAVQAHPARTLRAELLAKAIGGDVVYDPEPSSPHPGPWRTFRRLLELTPPDATHRLQIQDDALVCRSFRGAVEAAVEAQPGRVLVFFVGTEPKPYRDRVLRACDRDLPWAELPVFGYVHWLPTVCTCWPAAMIPELLDWVDAQGWPDKFFADDERTGRFMRDTGRQPLASVPSLVEHPDDTPSLVGKRTGRHAACWIGDCDECDDPLAIDWTLEPLPAR
jgi:hypothetical protein